MGLFHSIFPIKGIRARLLVAFGAMLLILFWIISFLILNQWRRMILTNAEEQVESVTRAFSIFVIETFIFAESNQMKVDDALDYYIRDYLAREPRLRYIAIYDPQGAILVHSDPQRFIYTPHDSLAPLILQSGKALNRAYQDADYGWVIESAFPLQIASKNWGVLRMGFEAGSVRKEIQGLFYSLLMFAAIITVFALILLYILSGYLTASLRKLTTAIDRFEIDKPLNFEQPPYEDEISLLYQHFTRMQNRLQESQSKVMEIQRQIYQAEKLASIGRLASGVAHEINNPLNGIKSCLYAINRDPDDHRQTAEYLKLIDEGLQHIETIVTKLLRFARRPAKSREAVNLNEALKKVLQLLEFRFSQKQIRLNLKPDNNLPPVQADSQLMQEVFMNLLLNSYDAVSEKGQISVMSGIEENGRVFVSIADNGPGIDPEDQKKIFDPFFTTKEPGEGTGLGLSVSLSIVQAHGGTIEVQSQPGRGCEFKVILPIGEEK